MDPIVVATFTLLATFFYGTARADDDGCDFFKAHMPALYDAMCKKTGGGSGAGSRSTSTVADSFNLNPSSLPTEKTPYGLESILSGIRSGDPHYTPTFALIKGYGKIGTGLSTSGNNTFYGNDVTQRLYGGSDVSELTPSEPAKGSLPTFALGTSTKLPFLRRLRPTIGLAVKYNHISNAPGYGLGAGIRPWVFSFGAALSHEKVSNRFSGLNFYSLDFSVRIILLELEYTRLSNSTIANFPELEPINIYTANFLFGRFIVSAALRHTNYVSVGEVWQKQFGLQYRISSHVTAGYLFNYIPGTSSLAAQIFL